MDARGPSAPVIIGIAGGSASGKSRLADDLAGSSAVVLSQDDYYRPSLGPRANFDHPDSIDWELFESQLDDLRIGQSVVRPVYDFADHTRMPREEPVQPGRLIVVEGLHILGRPELRAALDIGLFVHTPSDLRLLRRLRRDIEERGRTVGSVLAQYEHHVRPMHRQFVQPSCSYADLVVDGTLRPSDNVAIVRAFSSARGIDL